MNAAKVIAATVALNATCLGAGVVPGEYWVSPNADALAAYTKESPGSCSGLAAARKRRGEKDVTQHNIVFTSGTYAFSKLFPNVTEKDSAAICLFATDATNVFRGATGRAEDVVFDGTDFPTRAVTINGTWPIFVKGITFRNFHSADRGGAVCVGDQYAAGKFHAEISDCVFVRNSAEKDGGAVFGGVVIRDTRFVQNIARTGCGGGFCGAYAQHVRPQGLVENCTFSDNVAPEYYKPRLFDTSIAGWCTVSNSTVESWRRDLFGREDGPFVNSMRVTDVDSLLAARDRLREVRDRRGTAEIVLADGMYVVTNVVLLGGLDSRLTIRAEHPGKAVFANGFAIKGSEFRKASLVPNVVRRLPETGRHSALVADVPKEYGAVLAKEVRPQLSVDVRAMTHARWPNVGGVVIPKGAVSKDKTIVQFGEKRFANWAFDAPVEAFGMTGQYSSGGLRVTGYDAAAEGLAMPQADDGMRVFFHGPVEEIDEPGEWAYDATNGKIVLWPDKSFNPRSMVAVATSDAAFFRVTGDGVRLEGLVFTASLARDAAVVVDGGSRGAAVVGCSFSAIRGDAISVDAFECRVQSCDFVDVGGCGVRVTGGDKRQLVSGGNAVDNCLFERVCKMRDGFADGAVNLDGVENRVSHCVVRDIREHALDWGGYGCVVEYCRFYDANLEFRDSGVVYAPGGPRSFGCHFRYNDVSGSPGLSHGIYPDDMSSGHRIYGNVVRNVGWGGIFLGGGRNNLISNNVITAVGGMALHNDNRGLFWPAWADREKWHLRAVADFDYVDGPVGKRWPEFARWREDGTNMFGNVDNVWVNNIVIDSQNTQDQVCLGKFIPQNRQTSSGNVSVGLRRVPCKDVWRFGGFSVLDLRGWENRLFKDVPPMKKVSRTDGLEVFVYEKGDFNPVNLEFLEKSVPGFKPIPWDKIGLYVDMWRTTVSEPVSIFAGWDTAEGAEGGNVASDVVRVSLAGKRELVVPVRKAGVYYCWAKTAAASVAVNVAGQDFNIPANSSATSRRWTKLGQVMMAAGYSTVTIKGVQDGQMDLVEVVLTQTYDWTPETK